MISPSLALLLALVFCTADLVAQDFPVPAIRDYADDPAPEFHLAQAMPGPAVRYDANDPAQGFHRELRAAVLERVLVDAVAVFFRAAERRRQLNTYHRYRPDSALYYLPGMTEANSVLILALGGV